MPPVSRCICGNCDLCRKRQANQDWRVRTKAHTPLSPEAKSAAARASSFARWNRDRVRRQRAKMYSEAGRVKVKGEGYGTRYSQIPEPTDEELDRRAAEMLSKEEQCRP